MSITKQTNFSISYDDLGGDFSDHRMNAADLGKAISEMAAMVERADYLLNKGVKTSDLQVTAPAVEGSFGIDFSIVQYLPDAIDIVKYLGLGLAGTTVVGGAALEVAKRVKDKPIVEIHTSDAGDKARVVLENEEIECDQLVAELVSDKEIRKSISEVISTPLFNSDNGSFVVKSEGQSILEVDSNAARDYVPLPSKSFKKVEKTTIQAEVNLLQINFGKGSGWRMIYQGEEQRVVMKDKAFLEKIENNAQSFAKGDLFKVELRIRETTERSTQSIHYTITKVLRHRAAPGRRIV